MYGVSTPSDAPIIFPASYTLTLFGLVVVSVCCPSASVWLSRRPKPSRSIRLVLSSANTRLVNSFVVVVMILLVRHIAEVQREHPAVAVDDVLRPTGQRMIDETLMVAVGAFHRHQREEGRIFVRTVFRDHQRRKTQRYRTVQRSNDIMPVRIFAEPNLFALEQYRFLIIFIDFQQREQTALIVDIGQSRRITDNALATRHTPILAKPTDTVLVGIIAAAPNQRQDAFKSKVGFTLQKLQPVYRIHRTAGSGR